MTRKQSACRLLRHPSSFFLRTLLKKWRSSLRKPRSNMTVSKLPFYSSIPGCNCVLSLYSSSFPCVTHMYFLLTSDLPPNSKLHNLLSLAAKDIKITPSPQDSGSHLILQHQKLMLDHFGHKHQTVLPEDVIQHLLLRVRISVPFSCVCIPHYFSTHILLSSLFPLSIFLVISDIGVGPSFRVKSHRLEARCPMTDECGSGRNSLWTTPVGYGICFWLPREPGE